MTSKEFQKIVADARREIGRKYGFRQNSYINFKVENGYFFCVDFLINEAILTLKPMYADDLWWEIWEAPENKKEPKSLRGIGAFSLSGQVLASYKTLETKILLDISIKDNMDHKHTDLTKIYEQVFQNASDNIATFLTANPDANKFYPDKSKMYYDPDRLLYLMALIHNNKEGEALSIIKEARKRKHQCMFRSGLFSDSYTYIRWYCYRRYIGKIIQMLSNLWRKI